MEHKDFEGALKALEEIVAKLEGGSLPLEEALGLFEQGVQLSRFCHAKLEEVERKVEILLKTQGDLLAPFEFQNTTEPKTRSESGALKSPESGVRSPES